MSILIQQLVTVYTILVMVCGNVVFATNKSAEEMMIRLGSEKYSEREHAQEKLRGYIAKNSVKALREFPRILAKKWYDDPEVYSRVRSLLEEAYIGTKSSYLGLSYRSQPWSSPKKRPCMALKISRINRDSPAQASGLKTGDYILAINEKWFEAELSKEKILARFKKLHPEISVIFLVFRNERIIKVRVTPSVRKDAEAGNAMKIEEFEYWFEKEIEKNRQ